MKQGKTVISTQVAIVGGGPSGLLLAQLLAHAGIDSVVLERRSREYVLSRIRAGVLESGTVSLLRAAGAGARMDCEGIVHEGICLAADNRGFRIDFRQHTNESVMVYGQTELTFDLYQARDAMGGEVLHEVDAVELGDIDRERPRVRFTHDGKSRGIDCDFIAGCDGFHGVCRNAID